MSKERWKPVVGYEGAYEVSSCGRVRSLDRIVKHSQGGTQFRRGRELKRGDDGNGYRAVNLSLNGKESNEKVHRLVLLAFGGEQPCGKIECHHMDSNRANNRIENLEWVTRSENARHAYDNGQCGHIKMSPVLAGQLRRLYATGEYSQRQIAPLFGICQSAVSVIVRGEIWPNAGGPITIFGQVTTETKGENDGTE